MSVFCPFGVESFLADFGLHRFLAEQALQFAHILFEGADIGGADDIRVGRYGGLDAFGHSPPPGEERRESDASAASHAGNAHARPRRLFDEAYRLDGAPPAAALD